MDLGIDVADFVTYATTTVAGLGVLVAASLGIKWIANFMISLFNRG